MAVSLICRASYHHPVGLGSLSWKVHNGREVEGGNGMAEEKKRW
jgi:hypothetical protein